MGNAGLQAGPPWLALLLGRRIAPWRERPSTKPQRELELSSAANLELPFEMARLRIAT